MGECYFLLFRRDSYCGFFIQHFLLWLYLVGIAGVWAVDCDAVVVSIYI